MRKHGKGLLVLLTIGLFATGLLAVVPAVPTSGGLFGHPATPASLAPRSVSSNAAPAPAAFLSPPRAASHPAALTFHRTVLVETFTGVWCHYCPYESQALYYIDQHYSHDTVAIAELHECGLAPPNPCLENFIPGDGTTDARIGFYGVTGFPTVFFDGQNESVGQQGSSAAASEVDYWDHIVNSSESPAPVGISQNAILQGGNVTSTANITSGVNGTYTFVSYLLQYVNKTNVSNGYGPHSLAYVVRATMYNGLVTLTAGQSLLINERKWLNASWDSLGLNWNALNLSVISFIQENRTKAVLNSNFAPVASLETGIVSDRSTVPAESSVNLTLSVTNTTTGLPVSGAPVTFSSNGGGSFSPMFGTTSSAGTITSMFTAPLVTSSQSLQLTASVNDPGYTHGSSVATVLVTPLVPPSAVRAVAILPANGAVNVNWTAPASGGGGVTYYVYTAPAPNLPYTLLTTTSATSYLQTGVAVGTTLWYKVGAEGPGGFGPNSSAVSATSVTLSQSGLPANVNWWVSPGAQNFTVKHAAAVNLFMGAGSYLFNYGPDSYAYLPANSPVGLVSVGIYALSVPLNFTPRLADLEGTVHPADASVSIGGQSIPVAGGAFSWSAPEGTYVVNATAPGYAPNSTTVTLTPGNQSTVSLTLEASSSGSGAAATPLFGGSGLLLLVIVGVVAVAVVVALVALIPKKGGGGGSAPRSRPRPRARPRAPPADDEET